MSLITFTDEQVKQLESNPYVKAVTNRRITYSDEFKKYFVERYRLGDMPKDIFIGAGFDIKVLGYKRIERASDRFRKMNNKGYFGDEINYVDVHDKRTRHRNTTAEIAKEQQLKIEQLLEENARLTKQIEELKAKA